MNQVVELLSPPSNYAVVQLPERKYPGVVVQGDTLNGLVSQLAQMRVLLTANQLEELSGEIEDLQCKLGEALSHYESVCADRHIDLPYKRDARNFLGAIK